MRKKGCLVCDTPKLKKIEEKAWELLDVYEPTIAIAGSYEAMVKDISLELGVDLTDEEIGAIAYHVASGG